MIWRQKVLICFTLINYKWTLHQLVLIKGQELCCKIKMGSMKDSSHAVCLVNNINKLYNSKFLCDVTLRAKDGCEMEAHWLILAAHSEFFQTLHSTKITGATFLDADSETLRNILDYLYTGWVKVTDSNRKQLLDTGQLLKLDSFVKFLTEREVQCNTNDTGSVMLARTTISQSSSNTLHISDFISESQTEEADVDFDIKKVKDESEEDDPVSSNLHVTFSTTQEENSQIASPLLKQLQAPVQIQHIVANIAGQQEQHVVSYSKGLTEDFNSAASLPTDLNNISSERNKRRKRSVTALSRTRFQRKVQSQQDFSPVMGESPPSDTGVTEEGKEKDVIPSRPKRNNAGRKGYSKNSSVNLESVSLKADGSDCSERCAKESDLIVNDEGLDPEEDDVELMEESEDDIPKSRSDLGGRVPPLPGDTNSEGDCEDEEEYLAPSSNKRKSGKSNKPEKKIRSGNFLTRWNKTSICSLCGFEGQISEVVKHKKSVHPEDAHVCPLCFNKSADHNAMVQHLKRQHLWRESGKYQCGKCGRDCHNRVGLLSHDQIAHGVNHNEVLVCETEGCNFYCASQSPATMEEHRKGHGDTFDYACDRCDKKYKTKKALKNHMYHHINSQRYQCEVCGYFTATPSDLKLHTTTNHSDGPLYKCHICGNNYRSQYSMDDHLWKVHGEKDEKRKCLQCDECDFITLWQGTLTAHKKIHVTEKNYACEICGKIFRTPNNLSSHRNSTHKECDLHCNFACCQHTTKTLDHMRKHLMIAHYYKGVKPYSCVYCPYKSMTGGNVRKHVMVQHPTEEVKYVPDRQLLAEMKAKWLSLDKSQWTDVLRNK